MKFFLSILFFITLPILGSDLFKDYEIQSPKLDAPKRGTLKGDFATLGDSAINHRSGSFSVSLPLSFPSVRGKMQYPFTVSYSPSYGVSEYGIGWNVGYKISRFREVGKINYIDDDLMTPWGRMIKSDSGYYYTVDLRKKIRAKIFDDLIEVYLPDGTTAVFGNILDQTDDEKTYAWYLTKTHDKIGRETNYDYIKFSSNGAYYLNSILYGGIGHDFQYKAKFRYLKNNYPIIDNSFGKHVVKEYRVSQISFYHFDNDEFIKKYNYDLEYKLSDLGPSFYLISIQQVFDEQNMMPKVRYNYDYPDEFLQKTNWENSASLTELGKKFNGLLTSYKSASFVDFNGDGVTDVEFAGNYKLYKNINGNFEEMEYPSATGEVSSWCYFPIPSMRSPRRFVELFGPKHGNQIYDLFEYNGHTIMDVCQINGERIDYAVFPKTWKDLSKTILADINGDLLPDLIHLRGDSYQIAYNHSTEGNVQFDEPTKPIRLEFPPSFNGFWVRDINGDGIGDIVLKGESTLYAHLGHSDGSFDVKYTNFRFYMGKGIISSNDLSDSQIQFLDINKDGLPDILQQGQGFITTHLNNGYGFENYRMPGVFVHSSLYSNMVVQDLIGDGNTQITSSFTGLNGYQIVRLKLERPSLGLMRSLNDGKGNSYEFTFEKSIPEVGLKNRKTMVQSMKISSTGQEDIIYDYGYSDFALNSVTDGFLGARKIIKSLKNRGEYRYHYDYEYDLEKLVLMESLDYGLPDYIRYEENEFNLLSLDGIYTPFVLEQKIGIKNGDGSVKNYFSLESTYDENLCQSRTQKNIDNLISITTKTFDEIAAFTDNLSCHDKMITIQGGGTNPHDNYSHKMSLARDEFGRVTDIYQGDSNTHLTEVSYDQNGNIKSRWDADKGTSVFNYNGYRLVSLINPDQTITQVNGYDLHHELPLDIALIRNSSSFSQNFTYDYFGRLVLEEDQYGFKKEYNYFFADDLSPSRIMESKQIEVDESIFGKSFIASVATGAGSEIAKVVETSSGQRILGMKHLDPSKGITKVYKDQVWDSGIKIDSIKMSDFDYTLPTVEEVGQNFLKENSDQLHLIQSGVQNTHKISRSILGDVVLEEDIENDKNDLIVKKSFSLDGKLKSYLDQEGHEVAYQYDSLARIRLISFPSSVTQSIQYDNSSGKISKVTRDDIGSIEYIYNGSTYLLSEKIIKDKISKFIRNEVFEHDAIGRVIKISKNLLNQTGNPLESSIFQIQYDGVNLSTSDRIGQLGFKTGVAANKFSKNHRYRADGKIISDIYRFDNWREIQKSISYYTHGDIKSELFTLRDLTTDQNILSYELGYLYNRFGSISKILLNGAEFATVFYDAYGDISSVNIVGQKDINIQYDETTRILREYFEFNESNVSNVIFKQNLGYSDRGNIANVNYEFADRNVSSVYDYSNRGFLQGMSRVDSIAGSKNFMYSYNDDGIMDSVSKDGSLDNFVIGNDGWVIDGTNYKLDSFGRVSSKGNKSLVYGADGRIKLVKNGSFVVASYYYDEDNDPILSMRSIKHVWK